MPPAVRWEIVGGSDKGGILVREDASTKSAELGRLSTGALVEQLHLKGDRLQYKLLTGEGPSEGWVSVQLSGKPLAVPSRDGEAAAQVPSNGHTNGTNGSNGSNGTHGTAQTLEAEAARRKQWATWSPLSDGAWATFPRFGDGGRPTNMSAFKKVVGEQAKGEFWGLEMPLTPQQLKDMGPQWLTRALHKSKALPLDNAVVGFTEFVVKAANTTESTASEEASWGGAGIKILLAVKYKRDPQGDEPGKEMFVKMPHEFTGKNERFKVSVTLNGDWAETMFYNLLSGKLPVRTPRIYYADMNRRTTNFIWIMERVPYGSDWKKPLAVMDFLPPAGKYRDWAIPCAEDMYYAHCRCLARFAGWYYHTAKFTTQVDECFDSPDVFRVQMMLHKKMAPLNLKQRDEFFMQCLSDPNPQPFVSQQIPADAAASFIKIAEEFATKSAPQCFPPKFMEKSRFQKAMSEAYEMSKYIQEISFYQMLIPEYRSLAHPNAQIDNAMFWKNESGVLECGLIDWGGASFAPVSFTLAGSWIGAEPGFLLEHEQKLLRFFADEYREVTNVELDFEQLYQNFKLCQAAGIAGCCANVQWCMRLLEKSKWKEIPNRFDKRIDDTFLLRCYFVQLEFILALLQERSPYRAFKDFVKRVGLKAKP